MSRHRQIASAIWLDREFRALAPREKVAVLESIIFDRATAPFDRHAGPVFRVADAGRRRPDLSTTAWKRLRQQVIAEDGTTCSYCGEDCAADPTVDHVRAVCNGGVLLDRANLAVSCRPCNSRKGGREAYA